MRTLKPAGKLAGGLLIVSENRPRRAKTLAVVKNEQTPPGKHLKLSESWGFQGLAFPVELVSATDLKVGNKEGGRWRRRSQGRFQRADAGSLHEREARRLSCRKPRP